MNRQQEYLIIRVIVDKVQRLQGKGDIKHATCNVTQSVNQIMNKLRSRLRKKCY